MGLHKEKMRKWFTKMKLDRKSHLSICSVAISAIMMILAYIGFSATLNGSPLLFALTLGATLMVGQYTVFAWNSESVTVRMFAGILWALVAYGWLDILGLL
jgi:hypothetical protein